MYQDPSGGQGSGYEHSGHSGFGGHEVHGIPLSGLMDYLLGGPDLGQRAPKGRRINVSDAPDLEARATPDSFIIESGDARFEYNQPSGSHSVVSGLLQQIMGSRGPNSTLTIMGSPNVEIITSYNQPIPGQEGRLSAVAVSAQIVTMSSPGDIHSPTYSGEEITIDNAKRWYGLAERATSKALGELHIDEVYQEFQRRREEDIEASKLPPAQRAQRTIERYLDT